MKNRSFISIFAILLAAASLTTSCDDMLTPDLKRYSENFAQDSIYSAFGILKSIQKIGTRTVILDAARSDLATVGTYTTDSIKEIADFENPQDGSSALLNVSDYYHIINSCNFYLNRVDTVSTKNGVKEMMRETAAVEAIRAWTYIQLVRYYGSVPYITTPIDDAEKAKALEKSAPRVTKDNLIDRLIEDGILRTLTNQRLYGLPSYGTVNNGSTNFGTTQMFIPAQLVIADAYLMKNEYAKAAEYYYNYFYYVHPTIDNTARVEADEIRENGYTTGYTLSADQWLANTRAYNENYVFTAGAANKVQGTMMTDLQNIFGFKTSSIQRGASANIFTSPNESYQQILPSKSYTSLNLAQHFCRWENDNGVNVISYVDGVGDGRLYGTAPYYLFTRGTKTPIIDKTCPANGGTSSYTSVRGFSINYIVPLYRASQVWLRYAEAINRLGFPKLAFGVLKDGLYQNNFPSIGSGYDMNKYVIDPVSKDTIGVLKVDEDENGKKDITYDKWGYVRSFTVTSDTLLFADGYKPYSELKKDVSYTDPTSPTGGMYYLTSEDMNEIAKYPYLDFTTSSQFLVTNAQTLENLGGIHARGCGDTGGTHDTLYTYARMVAKKIAENYARENKLTYAEQLAYENTLHSGDTLLVTDKNLIINAVEDLIVDEGALENAFEGHRFTDLLRIADHKTAAGLDGVNWLAWKMGRRNIPVTANASEVDAALFSKMQDQKNWYFPLPK